MKQQVVSFKVDAQLAKLLEAVPNKSEFIRHSILQALDNSCPLCNGTGILNPSQKRHWEAFQADHKLVRCEECNEVHLECEHQDHHHSEGHNHH